MPQIAPACQSKKLRVASIGAMVGGRAGGLDHLVDGAAALEEVLVRGAESNALNHLGFLKEEQHLEIAAGREEAVGRMGGMGGMIFVGPIIPILLI